LSQNTVVILNQPSSTKLGVPILLVMMIDPGTILFWSSVTNYQSSFLL